MNNQANSHESPVRPRKIQLQLGQLVSTPGAIAAMTKAGQDPVELLTRHRSGDWGDVDAEDAAANDRAATEGGERILSAYALTNAIRLWIITEADRSCTTFLLPDEY